MPEQEFAEEKQLAERVNQLEDQIVSIKARLMDNSKIDQLTRRITLCESLAGISDEKNEDVKFE
jgi:hypothetical protein